MSQFNLSQFWYPLTALDAGLPFHGIGAACALLLLIHWRKASRRARELEHTSRRYASAINVSLDAIVVADDTGKILDFNLAAERLFGCSRNVAMDLNLAGLIRPTDHRNAEGDDLLRRLAVCDPSLFNHRVKMEARHVSSSTFPVEVSIGMTEDSDGVIYIGYIRDISDQLRAQAEITQARDAALTAMNAKSQFLAVMSHEMRTPLNGVLAVLDILAATDLSDKQREFVGAATNSGELLQRHIDDLLRINELENQELTFHRSTFNVKDMISDILAMNAAPAAAKGNVIRFDPACADIWIVEDRHRLAQILVNLISNAIKFTEHGEIRVEVLRRNSSEVGDVLEFVVTDDGVGIAEEDQERIFETFVTLDPTYRQTTRGYGLGLAISRRIVRAMGGDIGVDSRAGAYSRFWAWVPVRQASPAILPRTFTASLTRPFELPDGPAKLRVLLVEDDDTNRMVAREMLRRFGCTVSEAVDGLEAVERCEAHPFDVILMDVNLPKLGGEDATRLIRQSPASPSRRAPIVGVTAHALPEEQRRLLDAGMKEFLIKPMRARHLQALLRRLADFPADFADAPFAAAMDRDSARPLAEETAEIDTEVFEELCQVLAPDLIENRLGRFRRDFGGLPACLEEALAGGDLSRVATIAHQHGGAAALFGATRLREILIQMESAAKRGEREPLGPLLASLATTIPRTLGLFAEYTAA